MYNKYKISMPDNKKKNRFGLIQAYQANPKNYSMDNKKMPLTF